jgi:hypothetical protein
MTIGHFQSTLAISKGLQLGIAFMTNAGSDQEREENEGICNAKWRFNADGSYDAGGPGPTTYVQVNPGEWYPNEPYSGVGAYYGVQCESIYQAGPWDTQAASIGDWIRMDAARTWAMTRGGMTPGTSTCSGNFDIATWVAGGDANGADDTVMDAALLASAIHTCTATINPL